MRQGTATSRLAWRPAGRRTRCRRTSDAHFRRLMNCESNWRLAVNGRGGSFISSFSMAFLHSCWLIIYCHLRYNFPKLHFADGYLRRRARYDILHGHLRPTIGFVPSRGFLSPWVECAFVCRGTVSPVCAAKEAAARIGVHMENSLPRQKEKGKENDRQGSSPQ